MKHVLNTIILLIAIGTAATSASAQLKPSTQQGTTPGIQGQPSASGAQIVQRADLVLADNQVVVSGAAYSRKFFVTVKNTGKVATKLCTLKVTYAWRIDHESSSNTEILKEYTIPVIEPGMSQVVVVPIPDNNIHSNEGFGSASVYVTFEADSRKQVFEESENNNTAHKSIPIVNH